MLNIFYWIKATWYEGLIILLNIYYRELPLRKKLLKKRLISFIITSIGFYLLLAHIDYVFYDFAYSSKAGRFSIYEQVLLCHSSWYNNYVSYGITSLWMLYWIYALYSFFTAFSVAILAYTAKYKEIVFLSFSIGFLIFNNWFTYAYLFYICQANVMILACFIYNMFYWIFHLIMWDEEMESYYENQVDFANKDREGFIHKETTNADQELENLDARPKDEMWIPSEEESVKEWIEKNGGAARYINFDTLEVSKEFEVSNAVETLADIEVRYNKHIQTFYESELELQKKLEREFGAQTAPGLIDDMVEFWVVNYLWVIPAHWWEDVRYWNNIHKYDYIRVSLFAFIHYLLNGQYRVPKVVGEYSVYSPKYKADITRIVTWTKWKILMYFQDLFNYLIRFFSLIERYQNWRWFLFTNRFCTQRYKLIKTRKTINYRFFKNKK